MTSNSISNLASAVNENNSINLDFLNGNTPVVSSLHISQHFNKKHKHVLRDIQDLRSNLPKLFVESNFGPMFHTVDAGNGATRRVPIFYLTRDAFSLLVMGFTGPAALRWKLRYIEAFNSLEAAVLQNQTELAREAGYTQGVSEALALPAAEADRKAAYLSGMREGEKLQKRRDGLMRLIKIREYLHKGLTHREIGKILGVTRQAITDTLRRARKMGLAA